MADDVDFNPTNLSSDSSEATLSNWESWVNSLKDTGGIDWKAIGEIGKGLTSLLGGTSSAGSIGQLASTYALAKMLGLMESGKPAGYRGGVPQYTLSRTPLQTAPAAPAISPLTGVARRPGEYGQRYFTPATFMPTGKDISLPSAPAVTTPATTPPPTTTPDNTREQQEELATGGIANIVLARGGKARPPRYLRGATDGMADKIPSDIDGVQPAKLSHGEFVVPADVVSHLGNGNSDAGAKVLYKMMDRVRQARTGKKEQGKKINPTKFVPGGIAGYSGGGAVAFEEGGTTDKDLTVGNAPVSREQNLSEWIAPYVVDYLGKGQALAGADYTPYMGPLTAGESALQQQAFQGIGALKAPSGISEAATTAGQVAQKVGAMGYTPTTFGSAFTAPTAYSPTQFQTGTFGTQEAQQYMNPYLQSALQPQLQELGRQSEIARMADAARLTGAGAYGGSRQAIMDAENRRNLLGKQSDVLSQGYKTAYDVAQQAYMADQARALEAQRASEQSKQFGATQGMTAAQLAAQYGLSAQQAQEASKQFGAQYGLDALSRQLQAAQTQSTLGQADLAAQQGILGQLLQAGGTQRGITAEGIAADRAQFEEERLWPYKQLQFQQSLISGLPTSTSTASTATSPMSEALGQISGLQKLGSIVGQLFPTS